MYFICYVCKCNNIKIVLRYVCINKNKNMYLNCLQ